MVISSEDPAPVQISKTLDNESTTGDGAMRLRLRCHEPALSRDRGCASGLRVLTGRVAGGPAG